MAAAVPKRLLLLTSGRKQQASLACLQIWDTRSIWKFREHERLTERPGPVLRGQETVELRRDVARPEPSAGAASGLPFSTC